MISIQGVKLLNYLFVAKTIIVSSKIQTGRGSKAQTYYIV